MSCICGILRVMQDNAAVPGSTEPSLDELRGMFADKALARKEERKCLSRVGTKILLGGALVLLVAFLCFTAMYKPSPLNSDSDLAAKSAELQRQLAHPEAGGELGAGTVEADERRGDLHFALDLLRYVNPETAPPKSGQATPSTPAAPNGK
jgi:hypothetical protein